MTYYWVSLAWATFGIGVTDGIVTEAAPIAKWCLGSDWDYVRRYYLGKGARIETLPDLEPPDTRGLEKEGL
jgi:hypothetical protein